jgi:branched-chain amino acid transport system permease protein
MTFAVFVQLMVAGLSSGSVYALVALGLIIAFKGTGILNFAHGELVAFGAYTALFLSVYTDLPYYIVWPVTLVIAAAFGMLLERALLRPMINAPVFTIVIATLAIGLMLKNVYRLVWQETVSSLPSPFARATFAIGDGRINLQYVWVIAASLALMLLLALFFARSRLGKAMRAVAQNREAASLMGISTGRIYSLTFAISAGVGASAGILFAPLTGVEAEMGQIIIKGFVAAILGGFYSLPGAVVGGIVIGLAETFGGAFFGGVFKNLTAFVLLVLILLVRPHGIFGRAEARRV